MNGISTVPVFPEYNLTNCFVTVSGYLNKRFLIHLAFTALILQVNILPRFTSFTVCR